MNPRFWRDRKVLITGHTGFKGGWLSLWLQRLGARVVGYALPPNTTPALFELARVASGMTSSIFGDIRDLDRFRSVLLGHDPEIVFHLAAQSLVRASYADPIETFSANVMGTATVLEACRSSASLRTVVVITSDKCYENDGRRSPYRENDRLGGHDPYSASKACAELVTASYRKSFFNGAQPRRVATARAGNVIGGGDYAADRLIPDLVRGLSKGTPVLIRNPAATRPWQHVLDPLSGYLTLAEHLESPPADFATSWNFGPDAADPVLVSSIADKFCERWGRSSWAQDTASHPHEAHALAVDSGLARERLRWHSTLSMPDAIDWTVSWYRSAAAGEEMRSFTMAQIADFEGRRVEP